jgi:SAM-dependent MidA family methyltransferase
MPPITHSTQTTKNRSSIHHLPSPSTEEKTLSHQLVDHIRKQLNRQGQMTFAQFMSLVLYTPALGYYANGKAKFGAEGDFITAPEVSPLFGACIARQTAEILLRVHQGSVLELGAGSGALAIAMLLAFDDMGILPTAYFILEPSAGLQALQKERLAEQLPEHLFSKLSWLTELPQQLTGVIVANEVIDALPVEVIRIQPNDSEQAFVVWSEEKQGFVWDWQRLAEPSLQETANQLHQHLGQHTPTTGYTTEVSHFLFPWMQSLSDCLQQGGILLLDYGYSRKDYWSPQRWMGTLRAYYRQRVHQDVFWQVGLQDITASVDFTAVAEAGHSAGLTLSGFTTQSNFLLSLGLLDLVDPEADVIAQLKIAQQIKTLTLPDEMGETFKAIAFLKGIEGALTGFKMKDLRFQL